jgi:uncharacterized protein involved in exopolysaccharide biosynthesis
MVEQLRHEEPRSPREQLARMRRLLRRGAKFWKGSLLVLLLVGATSFVFALQVRHVYRSECTVFAKPRIRTDDRDDSSTSPEAIARQSARLKDMLTTRGRLESAIRTFHLYPGTVAQKTMLDAVEQMKPHVGFRSLEAAQYVISFDGDDPAMVSDVTRYLAESLIDDYAAGDLQDLQGEADFLAQEEQRATSALEDATRALTVFLADHPEFALEAKQAATTPFGPSPAAGIPLMPKVDPGVPSTSDAELAALYRQRARLANEARGGGAAARAVVAQVAGGSIRQLDDQIAQAQAEVEAAAKRVAEAQADLASKSNLTEDHPDMRAARMAGAAAARQLHESKVQLAALQQLRAGGSPQASAMDAAHAPPDLAAKLRQVDAQIAARRAELGHGAASGATPGSPAMSPVVTAVVELETEWQRRLRALNDARARHDDLQTRALRAALALGAARSQAHERMAIVDPPFRPTHPAKGGRANVVLGGLAMAALLALVYAMARATLDDTLVEGDDLDAMSVGPVLGVIPRIQKAGADAGA